MRKYFKTLILVLIISLSLLLVSSTTQEFVFFKLDNGLEVYLYEKHDIPLVNLYLGFKAGAFREDKTNNGLSHLFEHMFFKANTKMKTAEEYYETLRRSGIEFNGYTSYEQVVYYFTFPKEAFQQAAQIMYDSIVNTALDKKELEKEREVVLEEMAFRFSDREYYLYSSLMTKALYGDEYYKKDIIGDTKIIKNATVDQLRYLKDMYFTPNNAALFIAGDIEVDEAKKTLTKLFSNWKKNDKLKDEKTEFTPLNHDVTVFHHRFETDRANFYMRGFGPTLGGKEDRDMDFFAGNILLYSTYFTNSKFYNSLKSISDDYYFYIDDSNYAGEVVFYSLNMDPSKVTGLYKALRNNLDHMGDSSFLSQSDFDNVKKRIISYYTYKEPFKDKTINYISDFFSRFWTENWFDLVYENTYKDYFTKVTRQDVINFAKKYIVNKNFVFGVLINDDLRKKYQIAPFDS